jgi:DNA repair protein RecN (Recombination protein N)
VLRTLRIADLAIIERVDLAFDPGFNVITGETGAGKSILLDALMLALGRRSDVDQVRSGAEEAVVEVVFDDVPSRVWEALGEAGCAGAAGDTLTIRRIVSAGGRSRAFVNDASIGVSVLREVSPMLLRIYGQEDDQALRRAETHLDLVDAAGGLGSAVAEMRRRHARLMEARAAVTRHATAQATMADRAELLRYQLGEIDGARVEPGEQEALENERARLTHAERLRAAVETAERLTYSSDAAVVNALGRALSELRGAEKLDPALAPLCAALAGVLAEVEDAGAALGRYLGTIAPDPERLAAIEERLAEIKRLTRKYGGDVTTLLARREAIIAELAGSEAGDERLTALEAESASAERDAMTWAKRLAVERRRVARDLERTLTRELRTLAVDGARFEVRFSEADAGLVGPTGRDEIEFYLATNPGEEIRPLVKVVSGGERSRLMLALKAVSPADEQRATLVFDEVDSGVGGAVGELIGRKLAQLGERRQVLAVTHLPVVAAYGGHHVAIGKRRVDGRTVSTAVALSVPERVAELARMLGGARVTPEVRHHAQQLLEQGVGGRGTA